MLILRTPYRGIFRQSEEAPRQSEEAPRYTSTSIHITYFQTIRLFQILLVVCDDVRGGGNTV